MPCSIGANHCRLRHIRCTSRPRETASEVFLNELLVLFQYPPRSAPALLGGALPLRNCAARFACNMPAWRLPAGGQVARLVTEGLFNKLLRAFSLGHVCGRDLVLESTQVVIVLMQREVLASA